MYQRDTDNADFFNEILMEQNTVQLRTSREYKQKIWH